jgi:predicted PurR-regulated permease PerM
VELDLQRFYNINRRILMWLSFFGILYLLRDFFAVMFLTFILGFVMRQVAKFVIATTRAPYWAAVLFPYLGALTLLVLLMMTAVPRVTKEAAQFSRRMPELLQTVTQELNKGAARYHLEPVLARWIGPEPSIPREATDTAPAFEDAGADALVTTQPTVETVQGRLLFEKLQDTIVKVLPRTAGEPVKGPGELFFRFVLDVVGGTLKFLLAILLSFLIVLDFDRLRKELHNWQKSSIGRFFQEAASSLVDFSGVVGTAFQCQMVVAVLNATVTCIGLAVLGIGPLLLLTSIVFLLGLIPVLGVWISSIPIVLIAFNDYGLPRALAAIGVIVVVHLLEAYVFNPKIYAARFHLNPVMVLIILLVGHETFGIWGMLLGIPVTHYLLNVAQVPSLPPKLRRNPNHAAAKSAP